MIVPTTQPETIEQYSIRAVEAWKLGRKDIDDGILVLMAKQDRTLRIGGGPGTRRDRTGRHRQTNRRRGMVPQFKQGHVYGGWWPASTASSL